VRDPARIDRLLGLLRQIWTQVPEWRLGQIICNAVEPKEPSSEIFYTEDERLEKLLARMSSGLAKMISSRPQSRADTLPATNCPQ
jgi:hypothetical protein